jgi:3-phenylpropionate/trans-cinnamate dioxygenase ferredoxin reductase component
VADTIEKVVIIGAGQAGGEAALRLRQGGFAGQITLVGEEPLAPYQRPPLSKKYLAGEWGEDRILLREPDAYAAEDIALVLNAKAVWIDRAAKCVRMEGLRDLPYDALILATGSRARPLPTPGADLAGVHTLRTAADVDAIRTRFIPGAKLVVIGAGYIGLEVAAVARQASLDVTVLEAAARPLSRVTSPEVAAFFLEAHTSHGVKFRLSAQAAVIQGDKHVTGVGLKDGSVIPADLVVVGVGITPEVSLAQAAGLRADDGIITDANTRTADPAIFAIGDCAKRPISFYGDRMARLESVHNALEGAKLAAAAILGANPPALEAPWFWSDQYDLKLQIAGLFQGYDHLVLRGEPTTQGFAAFYFEGPRLIAVDSVNRPAEFLGAKQLIQRGLTVAPATLQDMSISMKDIVASAKPVG